ncbi:PoNi-like cognate immunity protein [Ralstonia solanacearum]|uniref:PoNi-like cognate immunity protein n=2 Tax=Ralstonia solanacearum TaxID=305 RepID=UPI001F151E23|nr:PoNi-like cognate immunity protein [Ralstonia solanacearum]MCL9847384.1 PoNi-like cognate immunity protein [Ralstonia solanacearum]
MMVRANLGDAAYWNKWVDYGESRIVEMISRAKEPSRNPSYRPQYVYEITRESYEQMLRRYSRGDSVRELVHYFPTLLDTWEEAERLGKDVWTEEQQYTRHAWAVNFDHYVVCFWLVGLALALDIPNDQWKRLIDLVGNEGEDILLDSIIASRKKDRKINAKLCYPKPYQRLLDAVNAPKAEHGKSLLVFVENWYAELDRPPKKGLSDQTAMYDRPYWHRYGDQNFEGGAYFGRWCVEAVAAVKAFDIDDSLCLGHPNYPGDLLRPDGLATHPLHSTQEGAGSGEVGEAGAAVQRSSWLGRLFGK